MVYLKPFFLTKLLYQSHIDSHFIITILFFRKFEYSRCVIFIAAPKEDFFNRIQKSPIRLYVHLEKHLENYSPDIPDPDSDLLQTNNNLRNQGYLPQCDLHELPRLNSLLETTLFRRGFRSGWTVSGLRLFTKPLSQWDYLK